LHFLDVSDRGDSDELRAATAVRRATGRRIRVRLGDEIVAQSDRVVAGN